MRGGDQQSGSLFSYIDLEDRVPGNHPLRMIRSIAGDVLVGLTTDFDAVYSHTGRPSIAPEKLLRAMLLQAFYSTRSERQLMEQLDFNLLLRWFVGVGSDEQVWNATVFCKNRDWFLKAGMSSKVLTGIITHKKVSRLLSRDHFSVDGTLIEAWASMKSFRPKYDDGGNGANTGGGRNAERDFRGEKRKNDTHASTTDPDARLYRKGARKPAQLYFMGHAVMENGHLLAVGAGVTCATGTAEREAALAMVEDLSPGATLRADKAYDVWRFKQELREWGITPHLARRSECGWGDTPIPSPLRYEASQRYRKRIEEIFAWVMTFAGKSKTKFRGRLRVDAAFTLAVAAYNLIRLPKLLLAVP